MRFNLVALVAWGMVGGCVQAMETTNANEKLALLDKIEALVKLPEGASPLNEYNRSYAYLENGNVIGVYEREPNPNRRSRQWVASNALPSISDGGCSVVTVFFDPDTQRSEAMCNPDPFAE